jgi:hypothetical protein
VADLLTNLRDYLVAQSIVRKPSVAGGLPPLWLEPQLGTPAPGEGNNPTEVGSDLVLGAFLTGGFAQPPYMGSWLRQPIVQINFRGTNPQTIQATELAITKRLTDKRDFMLSTLYVVECEQWQALQRLGSDEQGFEYTVAYWFELYMP